MKKVMSVLLILMMATLAIGCGKDSGNTQVAATVNGTAIGQEQVDKFANQLAKVNQLEINDETTAFLNQYAVEQLVFYELLEQDAARRDIEISLKDAKEEYTANIEMYYGSVEEYEENYLSAVDMTFDDVVLQYRYQKIYDAIMEMVVEEANIDPEAIYNADPTAYYQKEQISASHILLETEEEANNVIAMLNDGRDFSELAVEYSKDGSAVYNEGYLGYFNSDGYAMENGMVNNASKMVDEFTEAAFKIQVGSYSSAPAKTQFGYHVIYVDDRIAAHQMSYEEAEALVIIQAEEKAKNDWYTALYEEAEIVYAQTENKE